MLARAKHFAKRICEITGMVSLEHLKDQKDITGTVKVICESSKPSLAKKLLCPFCSLLERFYRDINFELSGSIIILYFVSLIHNMEHLGKLTVVKTILYKVR